MRKAVLKVFIVLLLALFVVSCNEPDPTLPVLGVSLLPTSLEMTVGDTKELAATVTPEEATNKKVTWTISEENIAEIVEMGGLQVIAKAPGEAVITVKTEDGGKTASCTVKVNAKNIPVDSITLDQSEKTLNIGETVTLTVTVSPENATNKNISWSSNNVLVATVDANGKVTAKSVGEANITATVDGKTATCTITVEPIKVTNVSITSPASTTIKYGDTLNLEAIVKPETATNKNVTWSSSDTTVATVNQKGHVVAQNKEGTATITVTTEDGGKTAKCTITVKAPEVVISVTSVELNLKTLDMKIGESSNLSATVKPANATNKNVDWTSSNNSVATVDESGNVTAVREGTAVITVETVDGKTTATCTVTVTKVPVSSITLDKTKAELEEDDTLTLTATIAPSDASYKTVTWTSDNKSVATVDGNGNVTARTVGNAKITATADGKTATCSIKVKKKVIHVESITLSATNVEMLEGKSFRLYATVDPSNATDKTVTWTSDKPGVATVDEYGNVSLIAGGTATITAKADGKTATCTVTVMPKTSGALTYYFYVDTAYVTECDNSKIGSDGRVVIPDEYAGYKITEIGYKAFENCTNLKSVTIGQNVRTIGSNAFYGCTGLTSITIPSNVKQVNSRAFEGCSGLTSVTLKEGIEKIYEYVFCDCTSLTEITIPNSVTEIGLGAFYNCTSLSSVTIGSGVTSIGDKVFDSCPITSLVNHSSVTPKIEYTNAFYKKDPNPTNPTIGEIFTSIGQDAFKDTGIKSVVIPENITSIDYHAFMNCNELESIEIPNSVTSIGVEAFKDCSKLKTVSIGSGVTEIDKTAFYGCPITSLTNNSKVKPNIVYTSAAYNGESNLVIDDFYTSIDNSAFYGRAELQSITINDNIKEILGYAFEGCSNLSTVNFVTGSKLTSIGPNAFQNCTNLTSINLPNSVKTIDATAFSGSGLTSISIPDSVAYIDNLTFKGCTALKNVSIGKGVKTIHPDAFNGCTSLTSITIPDNVTHIYDSGFEGCSGLTSVTVGKGITSIGQNAFSGCTSITEYTFQGTNPPELHAYGSLYGTSGFTIYVPNATGVEAAYKEAWPEFATQIKTR